ncbi:MAG: hypothetical protein ACTSQ8_17410 [Candidatus Helarchaeota archaeon]
MVDRPSKKQARRLVKIFDIETINSLHDAILKFSEKITNEIIAGKMIDEMRHVYDTLTLKNGYKASVDQRYGLTYLIGYGTKINEVLMRTILVYLATPTEINKDSLIYSMLYRSLNAKEVSCD